VADPARISRDGHVITGGGVTAGIDLALAVTAEIAGEPFAQGVQLGLEYAPQPPFECGRPELAPAPIVAAARERLQALGQDRRAAAQRAAQRDLARQRMT
jgi:transcriptional regulator GlxA family with amidase domain